MFSAVAVTDARRSRPAGASSRSAAVPVAVFIATAMPDRKRAMNSSATVLATRKSAVLTAASPTAVRSAGRRPIWSERGASRSSEVSVPRA
jgi:hypothetical protein